MWSPHRGRDGKRGESPRAGRVFLSRAVGRGGLIVADAAGRARADRTLDDSFARKAAKGVRGPPAGAAPAHKAVEARMGGVAALIPVDSVSPGQADCSSRDFLRAAWEVVTPSAP